jgi:hypothetical protein
MDVTAGDLVEPGRLGRAPATGGVPGPAAAVAPAPASATPTSSTTPTTPTTPTTTAPTITGVYNGATVALTLISTSQVLGSCLRAP